jgi:hypothetical protein
MDAVTFVEPERAASVLVDLVADAPRAAEPAAAADFSAPDVLVPRRRGAQDVHILPLAREVDRAVLPFFPQHGEPAILHAHRVILLVPGTALARKVAANVERRLQPVALVEREPLAVDREHPTAGIQGILHQVAVLLRRELMQGNRVHINLSSGTKLVAFAAGLAGMAHVRPGQGSLYYVQPEGYLVSEEDAEEHGHTKGMLDVEEVQLLPILLPEPLQLRLLTFLQHQPERRATYRETIAFLSRIEGSGYEAARHGTPRTVRNWNNAVTTRMVRNLLTPLQSQGLLNLVALGREKGIHLGPRGLLYAALGGLTRDQVSLPLGPSSTMSTPMRG